MKSGGRADGNVLCEAETVGRQEREEDVKKKQSRKKEEC